MPKYQIILESEAQMPDDEFREHAEPACRYINDCEFKVLEARNLEGIREEVWRTPTPTTFGNEPLAKSKLVMKSTDISDLL